MSSAIDNTFHFVRNPTAINGLQTTYVSKRGSDVTGDGTAQNPYASLAKATSVATANTNIMLDDGDWEEIRTANNRAFYWWGNTKTIWGCEFSVQRLYTGEHFYFLSLHDLYITYDNGSVYFHNCILRSMFNDNMIARVFAYDSIIYGVKLSGYTSSGYITHSIIINCSLNNMNIIHNSIIYTTNNPSNLNLRESVCCNFCNYNIPANSIKCINNATTGQTFADYFNKYDAIDWTESDFTAKEGSKNIGAGEKCTTIGLNQGYTMYADNSADDMFSQSNGATLKNIEWNSTLNGYTLIQKERICAGATANTITLDSNASAVDDYYNNLFVGIVSGDGYGELFLISDYDGATKTATIDGTWNTTPTTDSIYTISGTILSAVKDFGKAIKVKRNWTFADNFTELDDGQWAEFMTHVETNSKQFPASCYSYEYSTDGVNFIQGQTADDLVSATNGENKVTDNIYGDCSPNYNEATAKNLVMRYIRVLVHIGFNIG